MFLKKVGEAFLSKTNKQKRLRNCILTKKKMAEVKLRDNVQLGKYLPHMSEKEHIINIKPGISNPSPR